MYMGILEEVTTLTGCLKPCFYIKYIVQREKHATAFK